MTADDLAFLKSRIDEVVVLDIVQGEHIFAKPLVVFDEGDTPDVFYLEVEPGPDDTYIEKGTAGYSVLLSDIVAVHLPPAL
jgi:hypothetical protein